MKDRTLRQLELALVLGVAFSGAWIGSSNARLFSRVLHSPGIRNLQLVEALTTESIALCVLAYVLLRQGRGFREIGLSVGWRDLPISVLIAVSAYAAYYVAYFGVQYGCYFTQGHFLDPRHVSTLMQSQASTGGLVFLAVLNPFYEELIVRAYTMSELRSLSQTAAVPILASVALQASYHFYLGLPLATAVAGSFLVYSLYYYRSGRIFPVILAHFYADLLPMLCSRHH